MMVMGGRHGGKYLPKLYQGEALPNMMLIDMKSLGEMYLPGWDHAI
jgi:hypothetical protein